MLCLSGNGAGVVGAGVVGGNLGQEGMHHRVLTFTEQCIPKKHLFLSPSKWLGTILLDYDGDKL